MFQTITANTLVPKNKVCCDNKERSLLYYETAGCGFCIASYAFRSCDNSPFTRHLTHKALLCICVCMTGIIQRHCSTHTRESKERNQKKEKRTKSVCKDFVRRFFSICFMLRWGKAQMPQAEICERQKTPQA